MTEIERKTYSAAVRLLQRERVQYKPCIMVLWDMVLTGHTYREALSDWAAYEHDGAWPLERWHSEICYRFLKAGIVGHPADMMEQWRKEICHED